LITLRTEEEWNETKRFAHELLSHSTTKLSFTQNTNSLTTLSSVSTPVLRIHVSPAEEETISLFPLSSLSPSPTPTTTTSKTQISTTPISTTPSPFTTTSNRDKASKTNKHLVSVPSPPISPLCDTTGNEWKTQNRENSTTVPSTTLRASIAQISMSTRDACELAIEEVKRLTLTASHSLDENTETTIVPTTLDLAHRTASEVLRASDAIKLQTTQLSQSLVANTIPLDEHTHLLAKQTVHDCVVESDAIVASIRAL